MCAWKGDLGDEPGGTQQDSCGASYTEHEWRLYARLVGGVLGRHPVLGKCWDGCWIPHSMSWGWLHDVLTGFTFLLMGLVHVLFSLAKHKKHMLVTGCHATCDRQCIMIRPSD